jgi:hypothetical protein
VRGSVGRALAALGELRPPTAAELEGAAALGRERADQGLNVDGVLHAYRISISAVWTRFGELARERGLDVTSVLAFSVTLWLWGDAVMEVVGAAHRDVELELAREEQQLRDAFVLAILLGTIDAAGLSRESAGFGLDPECEYVAFRPRSLPGAPARRVLLDGDDRLVTALDHDLVGLSALRPSAAPGTVVGVGPPARLAGLPAAFALAGRALQTALASGQQGAFSLPELGIRPAILADEALGEVFCAPHLEPLASLGRLGGELEATLRAFFEYDLHVEDTDHVRRAPARTVGRRVRPLPASPRRGAVWPRPGRCSRVRASSGARRARPLARATSRRAARGGRPRAHAAAARVRIGRSGSG